MENDLQPGVNVEENPLSKALEIQTERVLNVLEAAMLQAMNDIRATFNDLSEAREAVFEAKIHAEVARASGSRHIALIDKMVSLGHYESAELAQMDVDNLRKTIFGDHTSPEIDTCNKKS